MPNGGLLLSFHLGDEKSVIGCRRDENGNAHCSVKTDKWSPLGHNVNEWMFLLEKAHYHKELAKKEIAKLPKDGTYQERLKNDVMHYSYSYPTGSVNCTHIIEKNYTECSTQRRKLDEFTSSAFLTQLKKLPAKKNPEQPFEEKKESEVQ